MKLKTKLFTCPCGRSCRVPADLAPEDGICYVCRQRDKLVAAGIELEDKSWKEA